MSFREYPTVPSYADVAREILEYWQQQDIFVRSVTERGKGVQRCVFYEGPPSANGRPGIHHMMGRTLKDIFCRYHSLKGLSVPRVGGWDTHGLPIELKVEEELGIRKEDIGKTISVETFNAHCLAAVGRYLKDWEVLTYEMGYWVDLSRAYRTCSAKYMESVWWLLQRIHRAQALIKDYSIQPYSPGAGTALSSHELNQPGCYRLVKDLSLVVQFEMEDVGSLGAGWQEHMAEVEGVFFLAWTTTPWTLPANTALCVHQDLEYAVLGTYQPYTGSRVVVILAVECVARFFEPAQRMDVAWWSEDAKQGLASGESRPDKADKKKKEQKEKKSQREKKQSDKDERGSGAWQGGAGGYVELQRVRGQDLVGQRYKAPFAEMMAFYRSGGERCYEVLADAFVNTSEGTGVVHMAPCYGADDYRVCKGAGMATLQVVDETGHYRQDLPQWGAWPVKEEYVGLKGGAGETPVDSPRESLDLVIAKDLKARGLCFRSQIVEHSYPHCWRTDLPIIYMPVDSWFIQTTKIRDRLCALNQSIVWHPAHTGAARFADWLENTVDWNVSRDRFWGTPLPIWRSRDGRQERVIGSLRELKAEIERAIAAGKMRENFLSSFDPDDLSDRNYEPLDLHRTVVDKVVLVGDRGEALYRENEVIDVWFDSGAMPYASVHYPFSVHDAELAFPADFIAEGVDQTRGWFFSLHVIAALCFDRMAFRHVLANGLVLDKDGRKMSKRLGNTVDPFEMMKIYGADIVRWYMVSNAKPWENLCFHQEHLQERSQKFFDTLFSTYHFFALYANLDGFSPREQIRGEIEDLSDRWILSQLHQLIDTVDRALQAYDPTTAARSIQRFTLDALSNWYVRRNRRRFWKPGSERSKLEAYSTLWQCLICLVKLISPMAPMIADRLYLDLRRGAGKMVRPEMRDSVHLEDFPIYESSYCDLKLDRAMAWAQKISSVAFSLREKAGIRVRQPLAELWFIAQRESCELFLPEFAGLKEEICGEINVKKISVWDPYDPKLQRRIKPHYPVLGRKMGPRMKEVARHVQGLSSAQIIQLQRGKGVQIVLSDGEEITLGREDVEIVYTDHEDYKVAAEGALTVALDLRITPELYHEGYARELVNRIQNERKAQGLHLVDRIALQVWAPQELVQGFTAFADYIQSETLAQSFDVEVCEVDGRTGKGKASVPVRSDHEMKRIELCGYDVGLLLRKIAPGATT